MLQMLTSIFGIIDNHQSHKGKIVRKFIEDHGFIIEFLPPYSSHLNPIELVWALFKRLWRRELLMKGDKVQGEYTAPQIRAMIPGVLNKIKLNSLKNLKLGTSAKVLEKAWRE
jgi:hypothetical protein